MNVRLIWLVLVSSLLPGCDKGAQRVAAQPEKELPQVISVTTLPDLPAKLPVAVNAKDTATSIKRKQFDTAITPDMVKNIRFDTINIDEHVVYTDKPLNLSPAGSTRISVTPKLFFKDELDLKQNYMDNIEGAAVHVEMKFD